MSSVPSALKSPTPANDQGAPPPPVDGKVVWFTNAPPDMVQISFALFALLCQRMSSVPLPLKSPLANGVQLFVLLGRTLCELNVPFELKNHTTFAVVVKLCHSMSLRPSPLKSPLISGAQPVAGSVVGSGTVATTWSLLNRRLLVCPLKTFHWKTSVVPFPLKSPDIWIVA